MLSFEALYQGENLEKELPKFFFKTLKIWSF